MNLRKVFYVTLFVATFWASTFIAYNNSGKQFSVPVAATKKTVSQPVSTTSTEPTQDTSQDVRKNQYGNLPACGTPLPENTYESVQGIASQKLETVEALRDLLNQGYSIQNACVEAGETLVFLDYSAGYWREAGRPSKESDLYQQQKVALVWLDKGLNLKSENKIQLPGYWLDAEGSMACNFDKPVGQKMLLFCDSAGDSGSTKDWWVFDTQTSLLLKAKTEFFSFVKEISKPKTTVFDEDLAKLFHL